MKQIVKITLKNDYAEAYLYLQEIGIKASEILKCGGQNGVYEKAREYKYKQRQYNEHGLIPFGK